MHAKQLKTSGISVIQHIFVLPAHTASFLDEARAEQQSGPIGALHPPPCLDHFSLVCTLTDCLSQ